MEILKNKIIWVVALAFALLKGSVAGIKYGPLYGLIFGVVGFLAGALIAIIWIAIRKQTNTETENYNINLAFQLSPAQVFAICLASLNEKKYKIKYQNDREGKIIAKLPFCLVSIGETITFQISEDGKDTTSLVATVVPLISSPVYNYQTAENLINDIKANA